MPPSRACSICRNRMGELCMEECAPKKDYVHFNPDMRLGLDRLPILSMDEYDQLTGQMKGRWMFFLITKIIDHLNGKVDGLANY